MTACRTPEKIAYVSRREASVNARRARTSGLLRPYHCTCGFWHLTSMSSTAVRRLRRELRERKAAAG